MAVYRSKDGKVVKFRRKVVRFKRKDSDYASYVLAIKELGGTLEIDERKKIYSVNLSSDGFSYGVNCRPVSKAHVSVLENDVCDDQLDKDLTVVWNSFLKQYIIVDGQHLFGAKPEKKEWMCRVIKGDVHDNEKLTYGCWRFSFTMTGTQRSVNFAQRLGVLLKEHEMLMNHYGEGSESIVNKIMARTSGYKLNTFKSYMVIARDMMRLPSEKLSYLMAGDGKKKSILGAIGMLDGESSKAVETFKSNRSRVLNVSFTVNDDSGREGAFEYLMNLESRIRVSGKKYGIITDLSMSKPFKDFISKKRKEAQSVISEHRRATRINPDVDIFCKSCVNRGKRFCDTTCAKYSNYSRRKIY